MYGHDKNLEHWVEHGGSPEQCVAAHIPRTHDKEVD